jgi:hypothetical protein
MAGGDKKITRALFQGAAATCPILECDPRQSILDSPSVGEPVTSAKNTASEIGAHMATDAYPDIPARSLEDFRTLQGARAWLSRLDEVKSK